MMEQLQQTKTSILNTNINAGNQSITALYARLSQDDGSTGDSNSIVNQKKMLEDYANQHGYTPYVLYIDDGYSGTVFKNRPDFMKMIAGVENGSIKRVIIKDMSRLGRDFLQVGFYTDILFAEQSIHFIAINDDVDSNKQQENDLTPFKNLFNEWYAKDCSKKIKAVKKSKGLAGEHLTTICPYGYFKNPINKKEWLIDDEASAVVKEIFQLSLSGKGPTTIASILKERKVFCPTAYAHSKGYPVITKIPCNPYQWNAPCIISILERIEYLGHTANFKTYRKSYKHNKKLDNDKAKWKIFKDTHEPIIDQTTFDIVQGLRNGRKRKTRTGYQSIFQGMLFCSDCGSKLSLSHKPKNIDKDAFFCSNYRHNTRACSMHFIRQDALEKIVLANLQETIAYVRAYEDDFVKMVMETTAKAKRCEMAQKKRRLLDIEKRSNDLDNLIQHIYEDSVNGKLTDERFQKLSQGYENEQRQLIEESKILHTVLEAEEQQNLNMKAFLKMVHKYTRIKMLSSELLHEFIDRIIIHEGDKSSGKRIQEIEIIYNYIGKIEQTTKEKAI